MKGNGRTDAPSLSADGTKVAFESGSTNLTPEAVRGVFVKDLVTGEVLLGSTSDAGVPGFGVSPSLSVDGTRVAFEGANLDPADTKDLPDIYVKDLSTGDLIFASTSDAGMNGARGLFGSLGPFLSADGTKVGFASDDVNLDPADRDAIFDSYVKDLTTGDVYSTAGIVKLVDSLPRDVRLVSATIPGGSCSANATRDTVTCTFISLVWGDSATATIVVTRCVRGRSRTPPR